MHDQKAAALSLGQTLRPLRGLWAGIEHDLVRMGIRNLGDLAAQDPAHMTDHYCALTSRPPDKVIEACFISLTKFAVDGVAMPWWLILRENLRSGSARSHILRER